MKITMFFYACCIFIFNIADLFSQELKWRLIPSITNQSTNLRFEDMNFINENSGWVIRSYTINSQNFNDVFKTKDGGISWNMYSDSITKGLRSIGFADSVNGWLGTLAWPGIVMFNTTNGGTNWIPAISTSLSDSLGVCGISVVNKDIVYGCGRYFGPAHLFKTTNGGINWNIIDMNKYITTLIDCHFFNKDSGFVVGGIGNSFNTRSGAVLFTSDGGNNWVNRITTPPRGQWGWKISFPDRLNGFVSLEKDHSSPVYFLKTTDGGETWTEKVFLNIFADEEGIGFINANTGWIGGWFFNTYKTTDGGESWNVDPWSFNLNRIRVISDTLAYGVGRGVYKFSRDSIVGISSVINIVPEKHILHQNYPNPFNPNTVISYQLAVRSFIVLKVYDPLGKEVAILVNEKQNAGSYNYQFSPPQRMNYQLSSGIYFYSLSIDGNLVDTKRMILLK